MLFYFSDIKTQEKYITIFLFFLLFFKIVIIFKRDIIIIFIASSSYPALYLFSIRNLVEDKW